MKKGKRRFDPVQLLRLLVQIAFFIFLPALFVDAYGGIRQLAVSLINGTFDPAALLPQLAPAIAILPATLLLGRFFCGWMCAFGTFGDFIHRIVGRFVKFRVNEKLDGILKSIKYILLAFLIVSGWILGAKWFASANPWDAFGMLFTVGTPMDIGFVLANLAPAFVLLVLIAAGSVFVERFFCRYLCPLGAAFALLSRFRVVRIRKPRDKCGRCSVCTGACAMGIPLYRQDSVASGECIGCMKCVPACPRKNVSVSIAGEDVRPMAAGALAVAAMAGLYFTGDLASEAVSALTGANTMELQAAQQPDTGILIPEATQPPVKAANAGDSSQASVTPSPEPSVSAVAPQGQPASTPAPTQQPASTPQSAQIFNDGTYSGSGRGYRGTTNISVTVSGDKITSLKVVSYRDDRKFFQAAYPVVCKEILSAQKPNVDAVSGATYSSQGIMAAVADALDKARI